MNKNHVPALDGLRGIACLVIFMGHFKNRPGVPPLIINGFSQYWSAVDLFFVISGFVIFLSLNRLRERTAGFKAFFKSYFVSRAFRILPVYILLILSYYYIPVHNRLVNSELFISSIPTYVYLFFGQSWYMAFHHKQGAAYLISSWSLCAEVFLYILSFFIVYFVPGKRLVKALITVAVISYLARLYIAVTRDGLDLIAANLLPFCRMDGFMLGGIVATLYANDGLSWINRRVLDAALLLFSCVFVVLTLKDHYVFGRFSILFSYAFYSVFYAAIIVKLTRGDFVILSMGPLKCMGTISYFVYLFHLPIISGISHIHCSVLLNFLLSLCAVVSLGTISWFAMERPLIRRGKSIVSPARDPDPESIGEFRPST